MSNEVPATTLRLIRTAQDAPPSAADVARENKAASTLDMMDARWIFAAQVAESLEGGRAALLRPARRERLLRIATRLGMRHFDASLVIAMVQDGARTGEGPLGREVERRLRLVREADPIGTSERPLTLEVLLGTAIGVLLFLIAIITIF